ncbi:hypothetical protein GE09DRAFT_977332 [Coniochaeta sp. 2T2.1]|nr:hypothetical protein GE09DRAFT_977332 [Coniochaeta sp. 2T2.1]
MDQIIHQALLVARQAANGTGKPIPPTSLDLSSYPTTSLQQFGLSIIVIFPALSTILVALRLYERISTKTFGADDSFILVATILAAFECLFSFAMMKLQYLGVHIWQLPPPDSTDPRVGSILNYIVVMLYNPQLALVKSSVLFFLLRLGGIERWFRLSIQVLNWTNIALLISVLFASIFTCVPVNKYWDRGIPGRCNNEPLQYLITSGLTVLTDILVLIIPIKIVVALQVGRKLKIVLISLLCSGIVVTIFSILRMHAIYLLYNPKPDPDPLYNLRFIYSSIECNLAIITATIPPLRGLCKKWFPRMFTTRSGTAAAYKNGYNDGLFSGAVASPPSRCFQATSGSGMALRNLKNPIRSQQHTRLDSMSNSEEEILSQDRDHIIRTTSIHVTYGEEENEKKGRSHSQFQQQAWTDGSPYHKHVGAQGEV